MGRHSPQGGRFPTALPVGRTVGKAAAVTEQELRA